MTTDMKTDVDGRLLCQCGAPLYMRATAVFAGIPAYLEGDEITFDTDDAAHWSCEAGVLYCDTCHWHEGLAEEDGPPAEFDAEALPW